ncbi:MAG: hypothetical protein L6Q76_04100 [Polyangiaceae bacterium]|nr:hypothetical protein [Polyangiaceae bacterium]
MADEPRALGRDLGLEVRDITRERRIDLLQAQVEIRTAVKVLLFAPNIEEGFAQPEWLGDEVNEVRSEYTIVSVARILDPEGELILAPLKEDGIEWGFSDNAP